MLATLAEMFASGAILRISATRAIMPVHLSRNIFTKLKHLMLELNLLKRLV